MAESNETRLVYKKRSYSLAVIVVVNALKESQGSKQELNQKVSEHNGDVKIGSVTTSFQGLKMVLHVVRNELA